jgi:hypothetical protein
MAANSVWDIPRNDIDAVREYVTTHQVSGDDWRILLKLQDDPTQLMEQSKSWPGAGSGDPAGADPAGRARAIVERVRSSAKR